MTPARQRIGLYGGAFDPPHNAHVALAQAAVAQLGLDVLYVVPTGQPWMKQRRLSAAEHRLRMAELAFGSIAQVQVDDCELRRNATTYTIDTLRELQARHATHAAYTDWFLLMGEDLVHTLPQWQRAQDLLREVTVAVVPRRAQALAAPMPPVPLLPGLQAVQLHWQPSPISSTAIRQGLQQRAAQPPAERLTWLQTLVPLAVAQYIEHHQLYLSPDAI